MNKKNLLTIAGVVLSFAIAVGGWALVDALIEQKADALLSMNRSAQLDVPPSGRDEPAPQETEPGWGYPFDNPGQLPTSEPPARKTLSAEDMRDVLQNWADPALHRQLHEPVDGQLTMEQAIDAAKEGLTVLDGILLASPFDDSSERNGSFDSPNVINTLLDDSTVIDAYLFQNTPTERGGMFFEPMYSYWSVFFADKQSSAAVTLNAVTGQIWGVQYYTTDAFHMTADGIEEALDFFASRLGFESDGKIAVAIDTEKAYAFMSLDNGNLYAEFVATGRWISETGFRAREYTIRLI